MILTIDSNFLGHPTNEAVRNKNTCNPWELPITHWNLSSLLKMGMFQPAMFVYRRVPLPRGMLLLLVSGIRKSFSRGGPFLLEDSPDLCEEVLRRLGAQKTRRALWESRLRFFFLPGKKTRGVLLGKKKNLNTQTIHLWYIHLHFVDFYGIHGWYGICQTQYAWSMKEGHGGFHPRLADSSGGMRLKSLK